MPMRGGIVLRFGEQLGMRVGKRLGMILGLLSVAAFCVLLASGLALGAEADDGIVLSVTGTGVVKAQPTRATISAAVEKFATTASAAERMVQESFDAVAQELASSGAKVTSDYFSIYPRYDYSEGGMTIIGYEARKHIQVTVDDLNQVGFVVDTLLQSGVGSIYNVNYVLSDSSEAHAEATRNAIDDARFKAETTAKHLGMTLGPMTSVTVDGYEPFFDGSYGRVDTGLGVADFAPVTVRVNIHITYTLK